MIDPFVATRVHLVIQISRGVIIESSISGGECLCILGLLLVRSVKHHFFVSILWERIELLWIYFTDLAITGLTKVGIDCSFVSSSSHLLSDWSLYLIVVNPCLFAISFNSFNNRASLVKCSKPRGRSTWSWLIGSHHLSNRIILYLLLKCLDRALD